VDGKGNTATTTTNGMASWKWRHSVSSELEVKEYMKVWGFKRYNGMHNKTLEILLKFKI